MSKRQRRNHLPAFKAKLAMAALRGEKTLAEHRVVCAVGLKQVPKRVAERLRTHNRLSERIPG